MFCPQYLYFTSCEGTLGLGFLAPTGAQGVTMFICLSIRHKVLNLHLVRLESNQSTQRAIRKHSESDQRTFIEQSERSERAIREQSGHLNQSQYSQALNTVSCYL